MTREQSKFENEQNDNDKKKYIQQISGNIKIHELQKITLLGNISHLKKGTLYQRDFYLILTLDPRNGLGYYMLYYSVNLVKEDNNNNNNNKAFYSVPHDWILKCIDIYKMSPTFIQFLTANNYGPEENNTYLKPLIRDAIFKADQHQQQHISRRLSLSFLSSLHSTCSTNPLFPTVPVTVILQVHLQLITDLF